MSSCFYITTAVPLHVTISIEPPVALLLVIHLDDDDTDVLVFCVICHFGDVPVTREEDEELVGSAVVESRAVLLVVVVDDVGAVLAVRGTGEVVDDAKSLHALYYILEVDVVVVAFRLTLVERLVLTVFHADHEVAVRDGVLALRDAEQVGVGEVVEECLPLGRVLLVLQVEVHDVDALVGECLCETVLPFARGKPFLGFLYQLWLVAVVLSVVTFCAFCLAALGGNAKRAGEQ